MPARCTLEECENLAIWLHSDNDEARCFMHGPNVEKVKDQKLAEIANNIGKE